MYDVIIVGGGISGLYMSKLLSNKYPDYRICVLEQSDYFGGRIKQETATTYQGEVSFPSGGARFNKSHERVIRLLKSYNMIDFRKNKGFSSNIEFIDSKGEFGRKFDGEHGFLYIEKVLKAASDKNKTHLQKHTFQSFAAKVLTKRELEFMLVASGYSGQLKNMNMYDALHLFTNGIRTDIQYFGGKFHILIERILEDLKKNSPNVKLILNQHVKTIQNTSVKSNIKTLTTHENGNLPYVCVETKTQRLICKHIVLALPKPALLKLQCPMIHNIRQILRDSVSCKSLCRTYAIFDKEDVWFQNLKAKVVTNNQLRYIIPMDVERGLIMTSYTDNDYTQYWKTIQTNQNKLKSAVVSLVKDTFDMDIARPIKVIVCHWECGVAYWNKNVDSDFTSKLLCNPSQNVYICGENYSLNQSWVEGALETCETAYKKFMLNQGTISESR